MIFDIVSNELINYLIGRDGSFVSFGSNFYLGLSTTAPTPDGGNITEPNVNGYARVLIGANNQSLTWKMNSATNGASESIDTIFFPKATGAWGTITHAVIFNGATIGANTPLLAAALNTPISPVANEVPIIETGNLTITIE